MKKIGVEVYTINELSEDVRKKVLDKHRYDDCDIATMDINAQYTDELEIKGYPTEDIRFSLSNCQGDGMAFYGEIDLENFIEKRLEELEKVLSKHSLRRLKFIINEGLEIKIQKSSYFHHYDHYNTMIVDTVECVDCYMHENAKEEDEENMINAVHELVEFIKNDVKVVSQKLEGLGYDTFDNFTSDEYLIEGFEGNECYFTKEGRSINIHEYEELA